MKMPAHMNVVFLTGDVNALRPELGDRRFMILDPQTAEANRVAREHEQKFSTWTKAMLARALDPSAVVRMSTLAYDFKEKP